MVERDDLHELTGLYALGALTAAERTSFEAHLRECEACTAEVKLLLPVVDGLARVVPRREPSEMVRERVLRAARGDEPSRHKAAAPVLHDKRPMGPWLAAAAAIILAVAGLAYSVSLQQRIVDMNSRLADAATRTTAAEQAIAAAERVAADAQQIASILTAPDLARIELGGQAVAPAARGRAFWSRSRGLIFTAYNLPPPPPGRTYQLWVLTTPETPVSAGLISLDASGEARLVIDNPPGVATAVAMAVTLEPAGGVPAPTGDKYLVGTPSGT